VKLLASFFFTVLAGVFAVEVLEVDISKLSAFRFVGGMLLVSACSVASFHYQGKP
jgi:hypothetical protein